MLLYFNLFLIINAIQFRAINEDYLYSITNFQPTPTLKLNLGTYISSCFNGSMIPIIVKKHHYQIYIISNRNYIGPFIYNTNYSISNIQLNGYIYVIKQHQNKIWLTKIDIINNQMIDIYNYGNGKPMSSLLYGDLYYLIYYDQHYIISSYHLYNHKFIKHGRFDKKIYQIHIYQNNILAFLESELVLLKCFDVCEAQSIIVYNLTYVSSYLDQDIIYSIMKDHVQYYLLTNYIIVQQYYIQPIIKLNNLWVIK